MKKIGLAMLVMLMLCGCNLGKQKLYVYNWSYYIPNEVIRDFEKKFNVQVVYDVFASNEEMFAKLKAGGTGYDITFPSGDYVGIMIREGMVEKLDKTQVANFKNIEPLVVAKAQSFDKGNEYSVPYFMSGTGIAVNKKYVKKYAKSMKIFNQAELKGRMTLLDDMREVMGHALKTLGYSVNSTNPAELAKAKALVLEWKKNILKFDSEAFAKGFAAGEFWVVQGYAENIFVELDPKERVNVDFFIPPVGGPIYIDSMVILKGTKNKDLAYKFINFIHEPEEYAKIADYLHLPAANKAANKFRKEKPVFDISALKNGELKADLGTGVETYNKVWQEIRVEN
jgi:spermidine/putrescine transport system substrate-binding protein